MKFITIEFDESIISSSLKKREKIAIYILGLILCFVLKPKYSHQIHQFMNEILCD